MRSRAWPGVAAIIWYTLLTGAAYPAAVTVFAHLVFPYQAGGSLVVANGAAIGSDLIGQYMDDPAYFWSRLSATTPVPDNGAASSGSNLGPSNPALLAAVRKRIAALRVTDPTDTRPVPVDLVTASGSGLDPDISPSAADYQVDRVAKTRGIDPARIRALVRDCTQGRQLGILGEARVNVLRLNLALDHLSSPPRRSRT